MAKVSPAWEFQSTLPYGSDEICKMLGVAIGISIHAPLRERATVAAWRAAELDFNPRSLTGATCPKIRHSSGAQYFNPRSLTGAIDTCAYTARYILFQSTLPYGSD